MQVCLTVPRLFFEDLLAPRRPSASIYISHLGLLQQLLTNVGKT